MRENHPSKSKGCGCLVAILAASFLLVVLLPHRPWDADRRMFVWLALVVPWGTWYWWSVLRKDFVGDNGIWAAASDSDCAARRAVWLRCVVGTITAVLLFVGTLAIRFLSNASEDAASSALNPAEAERSPSEQMAIITECLDLSETVFSKYSARAEQGTPSDDREFQKMYTDAYEQIAAKHHMTVAELRSYVDAHLPHSKPLAFYDRYCFEITVLQLDGLLILNMPIYWLFAWILFDGWQDFRSRLADALGDHEEDSIFHLNVYLHLFLCGSIIAGELYLLHNFLV